MAHIKKCFALLSGTDEPRNVASWFNYLSFDIMGDVGLGKDFAGVASGQEHPAIKAIHDHMTVLSIGGHVPWLLNLASRIPGCTAGYAPFFNWCAAELKAKQKVREPPCLLSIYTYYHIDS